MMMIGCRAPMGIFTSALTDSRIVTGFSNLGEMRFYNFGCYSLHFFFFKFILLAQQIQISVDVE